MMRTFVDAGVLIAAARIMPGPVQAPGPLAFWQEVPWLPFLFATYVRVGRWQGTGGTQGVVKRAEWLGGRLLPIPTAEGGSAVSDKFSDVQPSSIPNVALP